MPVISLACPKCGKEATEYAPNKWRCLHCGRKFLYEESKAPVINASASSVKSNFQRQAEQAPPGLVAEFFDFILHNKKWWLTPIIVVLLVLGLLVLLSGTGAAPFIYTLF